VAVGDGPSHIVPSLELKGLADSHDLLRVRLRLGDVDYRAVVLVHVLDAFIVLQVPHFDVALRYGDQNIFIGDGVDGSYSVYLNHYRIINQLTPMSLIDNT
jgi:hypothetical protein